MFVSALERRFPALFVPVLLALPLTAQETGTETLYAAVEALVHAKATGAPRAHIDALYTRLERLAEAEGVTAGHALAQCFPVANAAVAAPATGSGTGGTTQNLSAPPCGGLTLTTTTLTSTDILPIPDATSPAQSGWGTLENFLFASGLDGYLWDIDVHTSISHQRSNDLKVYVIGPNGQQITLTTDNNLFGYANVFNGTLWDDSALVPVTDYPFAIGQVVNACVAEGALGALIGIDPNGVWDLLVRDDNPLNVGALNGWSIDITTISASPTLAGGGFFKLANQTVPDAPHPGLVSTLVVAGIDNFVIDVDVSTGIGHSFPSDLSILLTSPQGTTVTLSTRNGGNRDNVFNGTVWDDSAPFTATDFAYVPDTVAPLLVPDGALSAFVGENPNGTWSLRVRDDLAGEVGFLSAWALEFLTCVPAASGDPFCTGDGLDAQITSACPCGNFGAAGNGCANSANANGGHLVASGSTSPDTIVLSTSGLPATSSSVYLKGDLLDDSVFGDGVRCAGGELIRLRVKVSVAGASQYPEAGDPLVSVRGQTPVGSGLTGYYQTYYRNAVATFCPPTTFNITNGVRITW